MTAEMEGKELPDLQAVVEARFAQSMSIPEIFFTREAARIAEACWAMARRFHQGGRLLAFGNGAWATDAQHVSVEFVHPVIVGKRALPALALTNDSATLSGTHTSFPGPAWRQRWTPARNRSRFLFRCSITGPSGNTGNARNTLPHPMGTGAYLF